MLWWNLPDTTYSHIQQHGAISFQFRNASNEYIGYFAVCYDCSDFESWTQPLESDTSKPQQKITVQKLCIERGLFYSRPRRAAYINHRQDSDGANQFDPDILPVRPIPHNEKILDRVRFYPAWNIADTWGSSHVGLPATSTYNGAQEYTQINFMPNSSTSKSL